ncbi:variable surface lipoprotein [Mycoplasmopsis agalactiae]|uniref:Variable surface lipoprotein W (VpmaW) n=1 Tax=Mycoplasmopsis agalactiae TaxID=2110 RepID=C5JAD4_MYCAA|nr:variable surface lipoprotein [Mycoplasmopsis agalactiae]CAX65732.1 Variable surface lipoprotein W (VpmaW) [Mycoplasmopsis agalactiae]CBH41008.1 Variable surface lipoprotein W (VpmaW) [Mycoplasmopsis agalactiae]
MKKSKFLLLGSLSSLAAIPFVAAKCGGTKDEEKKPAGTPDKTPGGNQNPGTEGGENSNNATTGEKKSLSVLISNENQQLGKIDKKDKNSILDALLKKNKSLNIDKSQLDVESIENASAVVFAKSDSVKYEGKILVSFTLNSSATPGDGDATTAEKKYLPAIISNENQQLGKIDKKDKNSILDALLKKNKSLNLDKSQLDVESIENASAVVFAKSDSVKYEGKILVSFTLNSSATPGDGGTTR